MYCTENEVISEFKNLVVDTTTAISTADITSFIAQADALINSYVSNRYIVPVDSGAEGYQILKMIEIAIVADRIRKIMEVKQLSGKDAMQTVRGLLDTKAILKMLEDIRDGDIAIIGGSPLVNGGSTLYSETDAIGAQPYFKRGLRQW